MIDSLVAMYRKGAITADHLMLECLGLLDAENSAPILGALPDEILDRIVDFAPTYRPNGVITNHGALPTTDQVNAARRWVESARKTVTSRSTP